MTAKVTEAAIPHEVIRLDVEVQENYDDFRNRFEGAVPAFDRDRAIALVERKASWSEVIADARASAPNDFLLYWKMDLAPVMSLAGHAQRATEYLMGNHVIAETMYRHNPSVALYVPLRCAIYEGEAGSRFAIEQPSTTLASLENQEITKVGIELDRKLAKLLDVLGVDAPMALSQARRAARD